MIVLVAVVGVVFFLRGGFGGSGGDGGAVSADGLQVQQDDGSVVLAEPGTDAPVVEVYMDFQCPPCKEFHTESGGLLEDMGSDGEATVHYRPVSMFTTQGGTMAENSLRAGAAAIVAAEYGSFLEYQDRLFDAQPAEGEEGFSAEELKSIGEQVGIDDPEFATRIDEEVAAADAEVNGAGAPSGSAVYALMNATDAVMGRYSGTDAFSGTPAVYINGSSVDPFTTDLQSQILDAAPGEVDTEAR
ncbi:thioredoxin domain-containing protein [Nocardiopsis sp. RSe5-2]|uniref:Thioredoxin domain-containing protein n=1 Tax=Nocardiopsis endophytica TaxID=3018445 RepID=A0ABT4U7L2_9ACTN|nr:thioredoxin domain-containing protein [Nocardiopsis endophytica]MDA2812948.1 thioredoxin domain-containing protein [Nocardiopsis endophytica]